MADVLLITKGSLGDIVPFLALGLSLKSRGNRVVIITQCHYSSLAEKVGLGFDTWDTENEYRSFVQDGPLLDCARTVEQFADRHIFPFVTCELAAIERHCTSQTVLVARHMGSLPACFIAERYNLPLVSVFTAVAQFECVDLLAELYRLHLSPKINRVRRHLSLPEIENWQAWVMRADGFLGCWPSWFAKPESKWASRLICSGFLTCDEVEDGSLPQEVEQLCQSEATPLVLITGGTASWHLARQFYAAASEGTYIAGLRAILVCPHSRVLPSSVPSSLVAFSYLPFARLMPHIGGIIHHGGTSIFVRALLTATPQLMLSYGADRPDTAFRVASLGVGRRLLPPHWTPENVSFAIRELVTSLSVKQKCIAYAERAAMDTAQCQASCKMIEDLGDTIPKRNAFEPKV